MQLFPRFPVKKSKYLFKDITCTLETQMKSKLSILIITLILLMTFSFNVYSETLALVGGTIIDLSNFGNSNEDLKESIILIEGEKITVVGRKSEVEIPEDAQVIDIKGEYVLPGLIDGFAALDNQAYANAYLYMGVTSIVGIYGYRRAPLFENANPSPNIYRFGHIGSEKVTTSEMLKQIEEWAQKGIKFLLLHYELSPEQVKFAIEKAHELGISTIGELGHTSYLEAIRYGINAFVHSIRYSIELAPPEMQKKVAEQPFGPPAREFRRWLTRLNPEDKIVGEYAKALGTSSVALMPTLAIHCIDLPELDNPWEEPIATILDSKDIHLPTVPSTGKHNLEPNIMELVIKVAENTLRIEKKYYQAKSKYLAGSGTDVFGTMPGISLHLELELLTKVGLSEREALAAATGNYAEIFKWNEIGQIKPRCRADIVVVEKNPLESIKNLKEINTVIVKGKLIDREKLLEI